MWTTDREDITGRAASTRTWDSGRRQAGRFVQSGRTAFCPVPVLRTSTTGRTVTFFPELSEPARPAAARPVSHDAGGQAAGESAASGGPLEGRVG
jgi:hypothetical protein